MSDKIISFIDNHIGKSIICGITLLLVILALCIMKYSQVTAEFLTHNGVPITACEVFWIGPDVNFVNGKLEVTD